MEHEGSDLFAPGEIYRVHAIYLDAKPRAVYEFHDATLTKDEVARFNAPWTEHGETPLIRDQADVDADIAASLRAGRPNRLAGVAAAIGAILTLGR